MRKVQTGHAVLFVTPSFASAIEIHDAVSIYCRISIKKRKICSNKMGGKYEDYDWDELPDDVKAAAEKLGYNQKYWDKDKQPKESDEFWKDLTPEQQEAAKVLGYDETTWDEDDD